MISAQTLLDLGWPQGPLIGIGLHTAETLTQQMGETDDDAILQTLESVRKNARASRHDPALEELSQAWRDHRRRTQAQASSKLREKPLEYSCWGRDMIDSGAIKQIRQAASLPISRAAAVMPDAHVGYGLPIGGVLATEGAVIPYGVGVDIACRMRLSICPAPPSAIERWRKDLRETLIRETRFGVGVAWEKGNRPSHPVMDDPTWDAQPLLRELKNTAAIQLGTSGGGNHFVEWGILELNEPAPELDVEPGKYLALLSHSGSRGAGAQIATYYSKLAQSLHPHLPHEVRHLAWLTLNSDPGAAYWAAMTLAGRYAAANHAIIHARVLAAMGLEPLTHVENHHNYAWEEQLPDGTDVIVHRKGATPAGKGVLGVIPGSMGDPGFVVRGRGNSASLNSAAHGAGRKISRAQAFKRLDTQDWAAYLQRRNVELIGGSLDEAPMAYKPIKEVMAAQKELVEIVATFTPRIVRMAEGGRSRPRRHKSKGGRRKKRRK